jgi:hypothetical protein
VRAGLRFIFGHSVVRILAMVAYLTLYLVMLFSNSLIQIAFRIHTLHVHFSTSSLWVALFMFVPVIVPYLRRFRRDA